MDRDMAVLTQLVNFRRLGEFARVELNGKDMRMVGAREEVSADCRPPGRD